MKRCINTGDMLLAGGTLQGCPCPISPFCLGLDTSITGGFQRPLQVLAALGRGCWKEAQVLPQGTGRDTCPAWPARPSPPSWMYGTTPPFAPRPLRLSAFERGHSAETPRASCPRHLGGPGLSAGRGSPAAKRSGAARCAQGGHEGAGAQRRRQQRLAGGGGGGAGGGGGVHRSVTRCVCYVSGCI